MRNKLAVSFEGEYVKVISDGVTAVHFIETVLSNRGLPGRMFADVSEARDWLPGKPDD